MNLTVQSNGLVLAPFTPEDIDPSLPLCTDPAVVRYAGDVLSESAIRKSLLDWTRRGGDGCIVIWTIADRVTGE